MCMFIVSYPLDGARFGLNKDWNSLPLFAHFKVNIYKACGKKWVRAVI